jgi:fermentation-respiration switch protein FrsA (DUF1100 family)
MGNLTGFFGSILAVYGLLLGGMFVFQRSLLYFPPADRPELASVGGTGIEAVTVTTEDGLELVHWYRPPAVPGGPVIVMFHGNAGHIGDRVPKYWPLLKAGFGVFFAEYRGYGGNPGRPTEAGLTADGVSVMAYLGARGIPPERIVLYGESLGTGLAIKLAADHPVAGLVLEAPPGSIADLAQAHYWYVPAKWLLLDPWNAIDVMDRVTAPLLLLHGEADRTVPVRFGRRVFEAAGSEKEALFLPTGGHADLYNFPEVPARVIDFVRRKVPVAKSIKPTSD